MNDTQQRFWNGLIISKKGGWEIFFPRRDRNSRYSASRAMNSLAIHPLLMIKQSLDRTHLDWSLLGPL